MKRSTLFLTLGLWLLAGPAAPGGGPDAMTELLEARLQAARKAFEGYTEALKIRTAQWRDSSERLYRWSRRILEAEQALAKDPAGRSRALKGHLDRMADLEKRSETFLRVGGALRADVDAARFFRLEAEVWIAQEKAKAKK
jgi:hypothetical protein